MAREAEISYATLAMATDYDCWHQGHDDVTAEQVIAVLRSNADLARTIIRAALPHIREYSGEVPSRNALKQGLLYIPKVYLQDVPSNLSI